MPSSHDARRGPATGEGRATTVTVADEAELGAVARAVAAVLPPRALVTLDGDLGAGKTTFVKAVAAAAGLDPGEIVSPTFGLVHVHPLPPRAGGPGRLVHADFYRLAGSADLHEIGWEDATAGDAWVFVEWPSRAPGAVWPDRLDVTIGVVGPTARTLVFTPRGGFQAPLPP